MYLRELGIKCTTAYSSENMKMSSSHQPKNFYVRAEFAVCVRKAKP